VKCIYVELPENKLQFIVYLNQCTLSSYVPTAYNSYFNCSWFYYTWLSFSPPWDDCQLITVFCLHLLNHSHLTLVTQLPN